MRAGEGARGGFRNWRGGGKEILRGARSSGLILSDPKNLIHGLTTSGCDNNRLYRPIETLIKAYQYYWAQGAYQSGL